MPLSSLPFVIRPADLVPSVPAVPVVFGDDPYLRPSAVEALARHALGEEADDDQAVDDEGPATVRFEGDAVSFSAVLDELRTIPMFTARRVVEVREAESFVSNYRKLLEAYVEQPVAANVLILQPKTWASSTKLAKLVEKHGLAIDARRPKPRDLAGWLPDWTAHEFGVKLPQSAADLLLDRIGEETGLLVMAVRKMASQVDRGKSITTALVEESVAETRAQTLWKILDDATLGDGGSALINLGRLLSAGEPVPKLLAGLTFSLSKLHHAGQYRAAGLDGKSACKAAGIPPFQVEKALAQHRHLGPDRVADLPKWLLEADLDTKGNAMMLPRYVLERLLVRLARQRLDAPGTSHR